MELELIKKLLDDPKKIFEIVEAFTVLIFGLFSL